MTEETRRERMERRAQRRREWAEKAEARAEAHLGTAAQIADGIPLGQPILVGHHSEKRARRDQDRIHGNMRRGVEATRLAEHHESKADGIERALDRTIFSDDENAAEALRLRIAQREAECEQAKAINRAWRKGGREALEKMLKPKTVETICRTMEQCPWLKSPMDTTNIRAAIRRDRKRLAELAQGEG